MAEKDLFSGSKAATRLRDEAKRLKRRDDRKAWWAANKDKPSQKK